MLAAAYAAIVRTGGRSIVGCVAVALLAGALGAAIPSAAAGSAPPTPDVFAFGDAPFYGSTGAVALNHRIVGMAATRSGHGYWLVASDGGIFSFGDARFYGSTGAVALNRPIVGMAATRSGHGYWLVASDGGIFSFGDAHFYGSAGAIALNQPIVGMAATPSGHGYWLAGADGRVFAQGDAGVNGTVPPATFVTESIVAIVSRATGQGFWLAAAVVPSADAKIEAAIGWFETRVGSAAFEDECEAAVEAAFGTAGRYASAYSAWLAQPDPHFDWWDAPRGALVFYKPDIFGADGHVGISLGDGYVISTSVNGAIGVAPIDAFQNPLGWTDEPW